MLFTGLPEVGWQSHWYGSINQIADSDKALGQWLKDGTPPLSTARAASYPRQQRPTYRRLRPLPPGAGYARARLRRCIPSYSRSRSGTKGGEGDPLDIGALRDLRSAPPGRH